MLMMLLIAMMMQLLRKCMLRMMIILMMRSFAFNDFDSFNGPHLVEEQTLNDVNIDDDVYFEGQN